MCVPIFITIIIIAGGVIIIFSPSYFKIDDSYIEPLQTIGLTLISIGTIGIIAELVLMKYVINNMLNLEAKFLQNIIPQILQTVNKWIEETGKSIPIDKNVIYDLLKIGYSQWFMKENFEKNSIPFSQVVQLYQDIYLKEFKEPIILDYTCRLEYIGKIDQQTVTTQRRNLINISTHTKFIAVNTAREQSNEKRYINKNGLVNAFSCDIFKKLSTDNEKEKYANDVNHTLKIKNKNEDINFDVRLIEMELALFTKLRNKDIVEITKIIENKLQNKIKQKQVFFLYSFKEETPHANPMLFFVLFCPYPIKPQERITVTHTYVTQYAENDFFITTMKSLTRGLTFELKGFKEFDTFLNHNLLNDKKDLIEQTKTLISTSSLMLPRSIIVASWKK